MKAFDIIGKRKIWYLIVLALILPGFVLMMFSGLNLGIDFTGGNIIQVSLTQSAQTEQVRDIVSKHVSQSPSIQSSENNVFIIRTESMSESASSAMLAELSSSFNGITVLSNEAIGPVIGEELSRNAVFALLIAMVLMLVYIAFRFRFNFAIGAVLALVTDVLVTLSFVSIFRIEVDSSFIAAILTIVGYSINNTIVIFDRIRENMRIMSKEELAVQVNTSIKQTLTRSINTVVAILLLLISLFIFGGDTTKDFVLIIIIGTVQGLFSSICLAGSFLYEITRFTNKKSSYEKVKKKNKKLQTSE